MTAELAVTGYIRNEYEQKQNVHVPIQLKHLIYSFRGKMRYFPLSKLLTFEEDKKLFNLLRLHLNNIITYAFKTIHNRFNSAYINTDRAKIESMHSNLKTDIAAHSLKLIYRASDNNFTANSFHALCDGHGPTITIIKNNFGNIFAGFTTISWSSPCNNRQSMIDVPAGLFLVRSRLNTDSKYIGKVNWRNRYLLTSRFSKNMLSNGINHIVHDRKTGPIFDMESHGIVIGDKCNLPYLNCCIIDKEEGEEAKFGKDELCGNDKKIFKNKSIFWVEDYEVFEIL